MQESRGCWIWELDKNLSVGDSLLSSKPLESNQIDVDPIQDGVYYSGKTSGATGTTGVGTSKLPLNFEELDDFRDGHFPEGVENICEKGDLVSRIEYLQDELYGLQRELESLERDHPTPKPKMPIWYQESLEKCDVIPGESYKYLLERNARREEIQIEKGKAGAAIQASINLIDVRSPQGNASDSIHLGSGKTQGGDISTTTGIVEGSSQADNYGRQLISEVRQLQEDIVVELSVCPHILQEGYCDQIENTTGLCDQWTLDRQQRVQDLKYRHTQRG